ncbi:MAG: Tol-Pal system beta propeller repeat protein TolB [Candidatus Zixiibacteriota bacterium]
MNLLRAVLPVFFLMLPLTAAAQSVRDVHLGTVKGRFQATPIGVEDVRHIGTNYLVGEDSALMRYVTLVVQNDIDFYADFDLIPIDSFFMRTYEIKELDLLGWKRLGADYVVRLEAEFPGPNLRIFWRLFFTNNQTQVARGTLEYKRQFWRELAHDVANEIVYNLTGERGIFRTRIAYMKKVGPAKEVYVADYDGANERQLTKLGSICLSPVFSPDGSTIYFTSFRDGDPQLFSVSVESGQVKKITNYLGIAAAPAVSPDGRKIACVLSKDGNSEIYVIDLEGRIIKRLTNHPSIESSPTWSPDGRMIAFSSDRTGAPQIYLMDSDGLGARRLTFSGSYNDSPIWSDRGDRITFVSRTKQGRFDLASIDTSGVDYRILTEVGHNENPHFSPDGKHIIFTSSRLSEGDIFTMDLSGGNQRRITRSNNCSNPTWGPLP